MGIIHLIIGSGIIAILYGIFTSISVISADTGNEKMQEIAKAIQEGASAYLARQYSTIALVVPNIPRPDLLAVNGPAAWLNMKNRVLRNTLMNQTMRVLILTG